MTRPTRVRRRGLLRAVGVAGLAGVAGCVGGGSDAESDDDPEAVPEDDDPEATPGADDDSPAGEDDRQVAVAVAEDFDSYVSEAWVQQEQADGEVLVIESYTVWDLANGRAYRRQEVSTGDHGDGQVPAMEYYVIEDTTYQVRPDGCVSFDGALFGRGEVGEGNIQIPDLRDVESVETVDRLDPAEVDGERVEVWRFDLGETSVHAGELTISVSSDTDYVVASEGWYEIGHADAPTTIRFEQRNHSFDDAFDIEPPEACDQ